VIQRITVKLGLFCLLWTAFVANAQLHHAFELTLIPDQHRIEAQDTITLSDDSPAALTFALHPHLEPEILTPGVTITEIAGGRADRLPALNRPQDAEAILPRRFRVNLPATQKRFTLRYRGAIQHALRQQGQEYARGFRETPGMISPQGVFLSGGSYWYPQFDREAMSFDLQLNLPQGWSGMTQGERTEQKSLAGGSRELWRCAWPQEEIYLIAGRYTEYRDETDSVLAQVMLQEPDPALAKQYLDATVEYVALYSTLLGAYPYRKFALVENFWETGYGMPSFTLLGPKVIRLPFILHSSYPHEILHNWWGNSVYVDYGSGNWAEGLTSYLADHLIKEQRAQGVDYRRTVLQKYTDYVRDQQDFALTEFRSRHSPSTEAVGYGKTLMLFHMLRNELGDQAFVEGLRQLYQRYRFRVAGFDAVEQVFSAAGQQPLEDFFAQWVQRRGAPRLRVSQAAARQRGNGFVLSAVIEQLQADDAYRLRVPVAVQLEGHDQAYQTSVRLEKKQSAVELELPARPVRLHVDPEFDVFRRLHRDEIPPAISQAMGAEQVLIVLPAQAPAERRDAYQALAETWRAGKPDKVRITFDAELEQLPADRAVWLFGWHNRFRPKLGEALSGYDFQDQGATVRIEKTALRPEEHAVVVLGRQPANPDQALGWLAAQAIDALPGLGRKLPHYGRYSYLAFTGRAPENVLKGQWPVIASPMSVQLAPSDEAGAEPPALQLPPRQPLIAPPEVFSGKRMQRDVARLSAPAMAGRGLGTAEIDQAAAYIAEQFRAAGLQPGGQAGTYFQSWEQRVDALDRNVVLKNVVGILPGTDQQRAGESLVIGAHYDHFGRGEYADHVEDRGQLHPGADDNASGVAVMLELARALDGTPRSRSILFIAFTGEEAGRLGSRYYVKHAQHYPLGKTIAMLNVDTVGRLGNSPLTVFGSGSADEWAHIFRGAGYVTGVAVNNVADDFGSSDQSSFIEAGVPAVQLFGTAHEDIHRPQDTTDKIDVDGLVKVGRVLLEATEYLAERPEPLHSTVGELQRLATAEPAAGRRVSFGTVPDFSYQGDGVRIDDVRPGTPAAGSGIRKGDIITAVNGAPVADMRDYGKALRQLNPGDEIRVRIRRDGVEQTITTRVVER
jgi:hypothetical protein